MYWQRGALLRRAQDLYDSCCMVKNRKLEERLGKFFAPTGPFAPVFLKQVHNSLICSLRCRLSYGL
jgi:hypothetical protein